MGTSSRSPLYRGHAPGPHVDEVPQICCQTILRLDGIRTMFSESKCLRPNDTFVCHATFIQKEVIVTADDITTCSSETLLTGALNHSGPPGHRLRQ